MITLTRIDSFVQHRVTMLSALAIIVASLGLLPMLQSAVIGLVHKFAPVADQLTDMVVTVEGDDVRIRGSMYKRWNCVFVPPMHASSANGQIFDVKSERPGAGRNWPARQEWAVDWLVLGGRGHDLQIKAQYQCFGDTYLFSNIASIAANKTTE